MPRRRYIAWRGETRTLSEWARAVGLPVATLAARLDRWGDLDRALSAPVMTPEERGRLGASRSPWGTRKS